MKDISIITPMYNGEKYIFDCLDSIYSNDMKNVEHILINDGSPNFLPEIKNKIESNYPNTIIIDKKENEGIGYAYRDGFQLASGRYFMFLDCDDKLAPCALQIIKHEINKINSPDIIQFALSQINAEGKEINSIEFPAVTIETREATWKYQIEIFKHPLLSMRAFKRDLFANLVIPKTSVGIDEALTPQLIYVASSIRVLEDKLYIGLRRSDSVSHNHSLQYFEAAINVIRYNLNVFENAPDYFQNWIFEKYCSFVIFAYNSALLSKERVLTTKQVLELAKFEDNCKLHHNFSSCYANRIISKTKLIIFIKCRRMYDLLVRVYHAINYDDYK